MRSSERFETAIHMSKVLKYAIHIHLHHGMYALWTQLKGDTRMAKLICFPYTQYYFFLNI